MARRIANTSEKTSWKHTQRALRPARRATAAHSGAGYVHARDLSWLIVRLAVGGTLLVHGWNKLMGPGVVAFASGSLSRRGIEPSLPLAYVVFFLETVGAICIMLGLFTRVIAAMIAVEMAIITFVAHWPNGYGWNSPGGGWEFPFMWGLIFFAIALRGGGPYSLDRVLGREI